MSEVDQTFKGALAMAAHLLERTERPAILAYDAAQMLLAGALCVEVSLATRDDRKPELRFIDLREPPIHLMYRKLLSMARVCHTVSRDGALSLASLAVQSPSLIHDAYCLARLAKRYELYPPTPENSHPTGPIDFTPSKP